MIWLLIAFLFLYWILSVLEDFGYITGKSRLWHAADAAARGLITSYVFYAITEDIWKTVGLVLWYNSMWWIFFDIALNVKLEQSPFYVGSGGIDLAVKWIAKKINWNAQDLMIVLKAIAFVGSTIFLIAIIIH
jgi:hypothetical protein